MDEQIDVTNETDATQAEATESPARPAGSKRGIYWIIAGLVATGIAAGYSWLKDLPKD